MTSIPTVALGSYLWTKTYVKYSNGTDTTSYSVAYKGTNGSNGSSSYTHIRYSANSDGSSFVSSPTTTTKYIGVYTGTSSSAPTSASSYTWSKYVGDKGATGNGINSITYYYATTTTQTAPSASNVTSTSIPTLSATNKYLWQKQVIDYTDSSVADKTTVALIGTYGDTGAQGAGYTVLLTNENHTFAGSTSAAIAGSASTNVIAYKNASKIAATITKIGSTSVSGNASGVATGISGLTATITNNGTTSCAITFNATTSLTTKNGSIAITMTVDSKTFTKNFSFALALTGARGGTGAAAITLDITSSNGSIFLNGTGSTVLTAHVYVGGVEQTVSDAGVVTNYGTVKWYKGTTYIKSSKTLTVNASDIVTEQVYSAQLEA